MPLRRVSQSAVTPGACRAGLIGCGETYYLPGACESVVHDLLAGYVLGQSAFDRELHWNSIFGRINNSGYAGAEMRAVSALDIALWDLLGQAAGQPIYNLLGGRCREEIRVYNTCVNGGVYQDQTPFLERPGELACDLLNPGMGARRSGRGIVLHRKSAWGLSSGPLAGP